MQVDAQAWSRQSSFGRLLWGFDSSHEPGAKERLLVCVVCPFDRLRVTKGGVRTPPSDENSVSYKRAELSPNPGFCLASVADVTPDRHPGSQAFRRLSSAAA